MQINIATHADVKEVLSRLDQLESRFQEIRNGDQHPELYTNATLAKLLQVTPRCLQNWRDKGLIDFVQIGHKIFYPRDAVKKMLENNKITGFSPNKKNYGKQ